MDLRCSAGGRAGPGVGIRFKLLVFMVPMAVLATALMGTLAKRAVSLVLVERSSERARAMALELAARPETSAGLSARREAPLLAKFQAAVAAGAAYAAALDTEGRVAAHSDLLRTGERRMDAATQEALRAGEPLVRRLETPAGPVVEAVVPVWAAAAEPGEEFLASAGAPARRRLGTVYLGLPLAPDLAVATRMSRLLWVVVACINLGALGLLAVFLGRMLRPTLQLAAAAERLGAGALGETVPVLSTDELGRLAESFNRMSRDLARITVTSDYLDSVVDNMPDALLVTDAAGALTRLNAAALRLLGGAREDWLGRKASELFAGPPTPEMLTAGFRDREALLLSKAGERIPVLLGSSAFSGPGGRSLIITAADIRELQRTKSALSEKVAELARSNQELEEFAFVASHDLQEPLRRIMTFAELTAARTRDRIDAEAERHLGFIASSARRLQSLIKDLLDLSRAAHGEMASEAVDLGALADGILGDLEPALSRGGVSLTHGPLPLLSGDAGLLDLLLRNLFANAIKFRTAASPRIHLSAEEDEHQWVVSVRDNGIGIDPQHLDKIFTIFQRLNPRDQYPGTGIGLALCRKIVERHGGRIWAESAPGRGTTFHFTLPKRAAQPAAVG
jgi:PAS domain S-box-containing protein